MAEGRKILTGLEEICTYTGFSKNLVMELIRSAKFPARKTAGEKGVWISNIESIDKWSFSYANSGININTKSLVEGM